MSRSASFFEIIGSYLDLRSSHMAKRSLCLSPEKMPTHMSTRRLSRFARSQPAGRLLSTGPAIASRVNSSWIRGVLTDGSAYTNATAAVATAASAIVRTVVRKSDLALVIVISSGFSGLGLGRTDGLSNDLLRLSSNPISLIGFGPRCYPFLTDRTGALTHDLIST